MSNLQSRLKKLSKELTKPGESFQKIYKTVKEAYYGASDEGKLKMQEQWSKDNL